MTARLASAAFRFALRGLAVFPLAPGSKIPPAGSHGCLDASSDVDVARARWQKWPDANIGIATGAKSSLWIVDVDGTTGRASLAKIEAENGALPLTVQVATPGGGLHLYWKWTDGPEIRNSVSRIAPHIDVRGTGGYVTAPPSIHPNGGRYRWIGNGVVEFAQAPPWLVKLALPPPPPPRTAPKPLEGDITRYVATAAAGELGELDAARKGKRNHALNRAAFSLAGFVKAGALPEDWARAQLETRAVGIGLPAFEARRTIESAFEAAAPRELPK